MRLEKTSVKGHEDTFFEDTQMKAPLNSDFKAASEKIGTNILAKIQLWVEVHWGN